MSGLSVAVCTHNPRRDFLDRTLESLRGQSLAKTEWELLLIDNRSTRALADEYDLSWHPGARHVREETLGLTAARLRGIREFRGQLLIFVDDDNVLNCDYLEKAMSIAATYPHLGAFGAGVLEPEFETPPPAKIVPFLSRLALRRVSRVFWSNNPQDDACCPFGAGLCVNRQTAEAFVRLLERLGAQMVFGRRGGQLNSNEDDIFVWAAAEEGLGFGVFPELRISHLISETRVTSRFMLRLLEDSRFSECVLYYLLLGVRPRHFGPAMLARAAVTSSQGVFALRCRLATIRGEHRAARYLATHDVRPLEGGEVELRSAP